jgi:hypothetical protein
MTYSKYLQQFVGTKGVFAKKVDSSIYQFEVGGNSVIEFVGDDFVCIKGSSFMGNTYCECIPLHLFVFKFDKK